MRVNLKLLRGQLPVLKECVTVSSNLFDKETLFSIIEELITVAPVTDLIVLEDNVVYMESFKRGYTS